MEVAGKTTFISCFEFLRKEMGRQSNQENNYLILTITLTECSSHILVFFNSPEHIIKK